MDFYYLHKFVTLTLDVMFVNGNELLITSVNKIKCVTVEPVPNHTADQLSNDLNKAIKLYEQGGFILGVILMNM